MKTGKVNVLLWVFTYLLPLVPVAWLIVAIFNGHTTANPVQYLERRSGDIALALLLITLACTPLRHLTGKPTFTAMRRSFGLYTFFYALAHFMLFIGLDYGWKFASIRQAFAGKIFLWLGLAALAILLILAVTSFGFVRRKIGKLWQQIHTLTYVVGLIISAHFILSIKGNAGTLTGGYFYPILAFILLILLLILRLPAFCSLIERLRGKIIGLLRK